MFRHPFFKISAASFLILLLNTSCAYGTNDVHEEEKEQVQNDKPTFTNDELIGRGSPTMVGKDYKLLPEVAKQVELMMADARKAGFKPMVVSSYRTYSYQNGIWERKYKGNQGKKMSPTNNIDKIIEYSTIPGTSRHHWGTDFDIIETTKGIPSDPLHEKHFNEGGQMHSFRLWLDKNANKYGFYLVYTNVKDRKGFKYEPWHFTYKPISQPMLRAYEQLDIKKLLQENKLMGSENFSDAFIKRYMQENVLDVNPEIK